MRNKSIKFLIKNKHVVALLFILFIGWESVNAPINRDIGFLPNDLIVAGDIPDVGENQQIIFTIRESFSHQDIGGQIAHLLTSSLLGVMEVKTIRSSSMSGFSGIHVILKKMWPKGRNVQMPWNLV